MAIYHFSLKQGSRAKGKTGGGHARYILRTERYKDGAHELKYHESGNMPSWADNPTDFWDAADIFERANAQVYTEFQIALPRELNEEQRLKLVKDFVTTEIGEKHPYTLAIHEAESMDGGKNPHVHIMFTTRTLDGIERSKEIFFKRANSKQPEVGGAKKDRSWKPRERLIELRESWETHCNRALKRAGCGTFIDRRTLEAQGIERQPEPKLSPYESNLWRQGIISEKVADILLLRELAAMQVQHEATKQHLATIQELINLRDFEDRVGDTLEKQKNLLEDALRKRESIDSTIESLNLKLSYAPGSKEDALEMANYRLFGGAVEAHTKSIDERRKERDEIAKTIETQLKQGWEVILDLPLIIQESRDLLEAQQTVNDAKNAYQALLDEISSPKSEAKCNALADKLYEVKVENETQRNDLINDAFSIREQIASHEATITDLERMLTEIQDERTKEENKLSPAFRMWISDTGNEITVGQDVQIEKEQISKIEKQGLKHQLSFKITEELDPI